MSSLILQATTRFLHPLLLLFSVFLLLRGHHEPGGGFTGGLVAASGFALLVIAYDVPEARRSLRLDPRWLVATGLLTAVVSGLVAMVAGRPFLQARWFKAPVGGPHGLELGTPLLFDLGVFLVVLGVTTTVIFSLAEE